MKLTPDALLVLADGLAIAGATCGARSRPSSQLATFGEIVFNTAMTGYQETLTDPSYHKQIIIQTSPHIGNTGWNQDDYESEKIWAAGFVVKELSNIASSWRSQETLSSALKREGIIAIEGVDTRLLTRHLRDVGVMKAGIFIQDETNNACKLRELLGNYCIGDIVAPEDVEEFVNTVQNSIDMNGARLAPEVTTKTPQSVSFYNVQNEFGLEFAAEHIGGSRESFVNRPLKVVSVDLGIKKMTPKLLVTRGNVLHKNGVEVINLPLNTPFSQVLAQNPDGIFFSNGPGDPSSANEELELMREALRAKIPVFGICMGNQILGRALGFDTYKLQFGHRGVNQPVYDIARKNVTITAHNHGFAVDLPLGQKDQNGYYSDPPSVITPFNNGEFGKAKVSHINLNDNCIEGIELLDLPAFSVQYHPEAAAGPHDAVHLFDKFIKMMCEYVQNLHYT